MQEEFLDSEDDEEIDGMALPDNIVDFRAFLKEEAAQSGEEFDLSDAEVNELFQLMRQDSNDSTESETNPAETNLADTERTKSEIIKSDEKGEVWTDEMALAVSHSQEGILSTEFEKDDPVRLMRIQELQEALPGLPLSRVKKVLRSFEVTLGYPSLLTLVPILRETMPDYVSLGWLKRMNSQTAEFALQKASEDSLVDPGLLNSMLQVKANAGSIQDALEFHTDAFSKHHLVSSDTSEFSASTWRKSFLTCHMLVLFRLLPPMVID
jgi:cellobiose-specific phosphotransferase system component IIA